MAKNIVYEQPSPRACFMLNENLTIFVSATDIGYMDGYLTALDANKPTAVFQADKIIGCWIEGGIKR